MFCAIRGTSAFLGLHSPQQSLDAKGHDLSPYLDSRRNNHLQCGVRRWRECSEGATEHRIMHWHKCTGGQS